MTRRLATVFGGTGFLGHAVVQLLAAQGYDVRIPTRHPRKTEDMLLSGDLGQIVPFRAAFRSDQSLAAAIKGSDLVVNLIGIFDERKKDSFQTTHVELAARIARLSHAAGVKTLVHVSARAASVESRSRFARSKALGEEAVRAFFPDAVILRPCVLFGPRDKFLNRFAVWARFMPFLPLVDGGRTRFRPVYVGDAAKAVLDCAKNKNARAKTLDLVGPETMRFKEMLETLFRITGRPVPLLPVPFWAAFGLSFFLEFFPNPPLTRDQVVLLQSGISTSIGAENRESPIPCPTALEKTLASYIA